MEDGSLKTCRLVCVAIPCHVFVAPQMAQSLARMAHESPFAMEFRFFGNAVSTFGRNELVRWAKSRNASHMLWIDTDTMFPPHAARDLIHTRIPFIGINYALKDGSGKSSAWGLDGERLKPQTYGIEEVSTIGFGLVVTRMDVVDAVGDPWFRMIEGERGGPCDDEWFCQQARKAGFPPHVDHRISWNCAHVGLHPWQLSEG